MLEDLGQGIKNEASVVGRVLADAPGAVWDEIRSDWENDRGNLIKRQGVSAGIGIGTGLLLSRSPVLGRAVLAGAGLLYGLNVASGIASVMGRAWDADSDSERDSLVSEASSKFSREAANAIETMPAFLAGGGAGMWASRRVAALDRFAFKVTTAADFPARRLIPEKLHFMGPGTEKLPASLSTANGELNVMKLSEMLAERHAWSPVEVIRSVRLSDMKASRPMKGTPYTTELGFLDKPGHVVFHTQPALVHADGRVLLGAKPSASDLASTMDLGIIQSGEITTIYQGAARALNASRAAGQPFAPTLRALFLDRKNQLAMELQTTYNPITRDFAPAAGRPLSYADTVRALSRWDKQWSTIESLPTDLSALSHPRALDMLKLGSF